MEGVTGAGEGRRDKEEFVFGLPWLLWTGGQASWSSAMTKPVRMFGQGFLSTSESNHTVTGPQESPY